MTEREWVENVRTVMHLRSSKKRPDAITRLRKIVLELQKNKDSWDCWREAEALSLIALLCEEMKDFKRAAAYHLKAADIHLSLVKGSSQAAAQRLARAALLYFKIGQKRKAFKIAEQVFPLGEIHVDPDPVYEELIQVLRKYAWERYEKRKKASSK